MMTLGRDALSTNPPTTVATIAKVRAKVKATTVLGAYQHRRGAEGGI